MERRKSGSLLIFLLAVGSVLGGQGTLFVIGLSSVHGENHWCDYSSDADYAPNNTVLARLRIGTSCFSRTGGDFAADQEFRWKLNITLSFLDGTRLEERDLKVYYQDSRLGHISRMETVHYGAENDFGNASIHFDRNIKFYREGIYSLRVRDDLVGSDVFFSGWLNITIHSRLFAMTERFVNVMVGSVMILGVGIVALFVVSVWEKLGFAQGWREITRDWREFWLSYYGLALFLLLLLVSYDVITTIFGLSYGAYEKNDWARVDMWGYVWLTYVALMGVSFFLFSWGRNEKLQIRNWGFALGPFFFAVFVLGFGYLRVDAVANNLSLLNVVAGPLPLSTCLAVMSCLSVLAGLGYWRWRKLTGVQSLGYWLGDHYQN
jgi:hypothetical protein